MSVAVKSKWKVAANPAQCRACIMCQLVCSLTKEKIFSPSKARIKVLRGVKSDGSLDIRISFTDECDNCGVCAKYCVYGALSRVKSEEAAARTTS